MNIAYPPLATVAVVCLFGASLQGAELHRVELQKIDMDCVVYDSTKYELSVEDQQNGPGSTWSSSKKLGIAKSAEAVINGGFFTPEGKPLGLVVAGGQKAGWYNKSSLGSGMYLIDPKSSKPFILRRAQYDSKAAYKTLLQTGPFLIDKGGVVSGLSNASKRPRSFICWDGQNTWAICRTDECSLSELANALKSQTIGGLKVQFAINLDGGRSSDLWVSDGVKNGPLNVRPFLNKPVRNFLVLKKK